MLHPNFTGKGPATDNQKKCLAKMGYLVPEDLTKSQATLMLDEATRRKAINDCRDPTGLQGLWFHIFYQEGEKRPAGIVKFQGQVIGATPSYLTVQLYDWFWGAAGSIKVFPLEDALQWTFYRDEEIWRSRGNDLLDKSMK